MRSGMHGRTSSYGEADVALFFPSSIRGTFCGTYCRRGTFFHRGTFVFPILRRTFLVRQTFLRAQHLARIDDDSRRGKVADARRLIYEKQYQVDSAAVEGLLCPSVYCPIESFVFQHSTRPVREMLTHETTASHG